MAAHEWRNLAESRNAEDVVKMVVGPMSRVKMSIEAQKLASKDWTSKSDPMAVLYSVDATTGAETVCSQYIYGCFGVCVSVSCLYDSASVCFCFSTSVCVNQCVACLYLCATGVSAFVSRCLCLSLCLFMSVHGGGVHMACHSTGRGIAEMEWFSFGAKGWQRQRLRTSILSSLLQEVLTHFLHTTACSQMVGHTEWLKDNSSPKFQTQIECEYHFEKKQKLVIKVQTQFIHS